jgi:hypothetical protein
MSVKPTCLMHPDRATARTQALTRCARRRRLTTLSRRCELDFQETTIRPLPQSESSESRRRIATDMRTDAAQCKRHVFPLSAATGRHGWPPRPSRSWYSVKGDNGRFELLTDVQRRAKAERLEPRMTGGERALPGQSPPQNPPADSSGLIVALPLLTRRALEDPHETQDTRIDASPGCRR